MFLVFGRVEFVWAGDGKKLQKVGAVVPYDILSEERERHLN